MVVYLSVKDDSYLAVLIPHRLFASLDIENSEPPMRKKHSVHSIDVRARTVWSPVDHCIAHCVKIPLGARANEPCKPAHSVLACKVDRVFHQIHTFTLRLI